MSVDPARGIVFVPTGSASPDFYGGERLGSNRLANSLLALEAATGKLLWHQQTVHHDLWDYDLGAQPMLVDLDFEETSVAAVVQATKTGMLFVYDRETGAPVFPIEERPVPASKVHGEAAWPTQPFSTLPALASHEPLDPAAAWGLTFWDRGKCRQAIERLRNEGIFTPPDLRGTLLFPGYAGGVNWGGVAYDAQRQRVVAAVNHLAMVVTLLPQAQLAGQARSGRYPASEFARQSGTPYAMRREPLLSPWGLPCSPPPWGTLDQHRSQGTSHRLGSAARLEQGRCPVVRAGARLRNAECRRPDRHGGQPRDRRRRHGRLSARLRPRERARAVEARAAGGWSGNAHDLSRRERTPVHRDRRGRPRRPRHAARRLRARLRTAPRPMMRALAITLLALAAARLVAADALDDVVVTARRLPEPRLEFPGSLARVDASTIALAGATHHAELLDRVAGVYVQRGSGQESLAAIRSPVLSGPGACGAFLVLEDGLPSRPVGFCNVNELFELNLEQASAVEVIRGPGPAIYGANAVHGLINVITPAASDLAPLSVAGEAGSHDYRRIKLAAGTRAGAADLAFYGVATRDGGFRADSGFDEAKLNLLADREIGSGTLRVRAAGTVLNQETAGFVRGFDGYRDPLLRESNPNPESYRDAWSARLATHWERAACDGCADSVRVLARRSHMNFLQHFLIGQPVEENGQTSLLLAASVQRPLRAVELRGGVDLEWSDTELLEIQLGPVVGSAPAVAGIRPAGRHYDYTVAALTGAAFTAAEWSPAPRWRVGAAARVEQTRYDYDNRMLAGNTDETGVPCPFGGCLYSRPADRDDEFTNFAPKLDVRFALTAQQRLYLAGGRGFRPPEMTELYRLQRQQTLAQLDSERLDSLELGWIGRSARLDWTLAAYALEKDHVILRDANAFNVGDGSTRHRGIEYELSWRMSERWRVLASGTFARHRYAFTRAVEGGERISQGNDVDTAPREAHHLTLGGSPLPALALELELAHVGDYFVDAANTARYPGHALVNARARYAFTDAWHATLRVTNLGDRRYADRADFAFGDYRYFPGRERSAFLEVGYAAR